MQGVGGASKLGGYTLAKGGVRQGHTGRSLYQVDEIVLSPVSYSLINLQEGEI